MVADAGKTGQNQQAGDQKGAQRHHGADQRTVLLAQHAENQDAQAAAGQDDLGQGKHPVHQCVIPAILMVVSSAA